ncbi:MAG: DUF1464 family protein [Promethearchaeota archaeon]
MVRVCGIDPGTGSWDILGMEDDNIFFDMSIPSKRVLKEPKMLIDILNNLDPLDMVVAPSGHGITLKPISEITELDILRANLRRSKEGSIMGIKNVLELFKREKIKGYVVPGVKQLSSVKNYYKYNKIDMGTADKVCAAAACIVDQSATKDIPMNETSFILVEVGVAFTATLAIENGKIVNGIGGSCGCMGFQAAGGLDSEVAYLLDHISKKVIYHGGVNSIAGHDNLSPKELFLMAKKDSKINDALEGFFSELIQDIFSLIPSFENPSNIKEIIVSGRARNEVKSGLSTRIPKILEIPIRTANSKARISKIAAQGAAIIANGLAGGTYQQIIDVMGLRNSSRDLLSDIYIGKINLS